MASASASVTGTEFDWFAVDDMGNIGHFSTAGRGPVHGTVLADIAAMQRLEELVLLLPVSGTATGHLPGRRDDWLDMARSGLLSFDWDGMTGAYVRAATPTNPIHLAALPVELVSRLQTVRIRAIRFAELTSVRPKQLGMRVL